MADNKYTSAISSIRAAIAGITEDMKRLDTQITNTGSKLAAYAKNMNANSPSQFQEQSNQVSKLQSDIEGFVSKQSKLNTQLHDERRKQEIAYSELFANEQKKREAAVNREANVRKSLNSQREKEQRSLGIIGTEWEKLSAKLKIAKKSYQDVLSSQKSTTKEIKRAEAEFKKYQKRVNEVNKATSNFSKNSLGGMVRGFGNLMSAFGLVLGAQGIAGLIKNVFETIKTIEKLEFTLQTVSKSTSEFTATQAFLSDITQRFGIDLVTTTERFTKFLAAANQSNLSFQETTRIFEGVSKAASVLGLRTDELSGVYLALEQMLSKGKVTTEELRRQLGERLPGAVGIMAKALGVTTTELDKMLKKGEVLSSVALPKFVKALEEAYNLDTVDVVDTLVASQQRLSNSWLEFVDTVNTSEGKLTKTFKALINLANDTIVGWEKIIKTTNEFNLDQVNKVTTDSFKQAEIYANGVLKRNGEFGSKMVESMIATQNKLIETQRGRIEAITMASNGNALILNEETKKRVQEMEVVMGGYIGTLHGYEKVLINANALEDESVDPEGPKKKLEALKGSIRYIELQIKKLEELREKTAVTSSAYDGYSMAIDNLNDKLLELQSTFDIISEKNNKVEVSVEFTSNDIRDSQRKIIDIYEDAANERLASVKKLNDEIQAYEDDKRKEKFQKEEAHYQELKNIAATTFDTFSQYYDIDLEKFTFLYDNKKNSLEDWMTAADNIIDSALDASLNRYDRELEAAQRSRDLIVENELASEKEKRIANEKFDEEERRIKTERAKAERNNTLVQIAVDTARGGILAYLSQLIPGDPTSIPRAIGAAAITTSFGLAQAAIVASQPLPEFAEGTKAPLAADTFAIVGDGGRSEAITENGKLVGVTPDKPTVMHLKKGQEVQKDANAWIDNAVYRMNMESNGDMLSGAMFDTIMHSEIRKMRSDTQKVWKEVKALAERPIFVSNKVVTQEKRRKYKQ